jgi:hypothetical protein
MIAKEVYTVSWFRIIKYYLIRMIAARNKTLHEPCLASLINNTKACKDEFIILQ